MRDIIRKAALSLALVIPAVSMSGADFRQAETAYKEGKYVEAAAIFESLGDSLGTSAELLGNIGNCYVKAGDYGKGMLAYQQALRIDPSDKEVRGNIRYVETKVSDNNRAELKGKRLSITPDSPSFFSSLKRYVTLDHLSDTWAIYAVVSFLLFIASLSAYIFSSNVAVRKTGFFGGIFVGVVCVVTIVFAEMAASRSEKEESGVLVAYKYNLRQEPYSTAKGNPVALTRGTVLKIIGSEEETEGANGDSEKEKSGLEGNAERWYKVRLNSDFVGWVPASEFKPF